MPKFRSFSLAFLLINAGHVCAAHNSMLGAKVVALVGDDLVGALQFALNEEMQDCRSGTAHLASVNGTDPKIASKIVADASFDIRALAVSTTHELLHELEVGMFLKPNPDVIDRPPSPSSGAVPS